MSSDSVFEFLETTLLDLNARKAALLAPKQSMADHNLSTSETAAILRRMTNPGQSSTEHVTDVMRCHYASVPFANTQSLTDDDLKDRLKTVDQTFDVKPIVVITTTTTTITVTVSPTPSPSPSPTPGRKTEASGQEIRAAALDVSRSHPDDRIAKIMRLALTIEASAA